MAVQGYLAEYSTIENVIEANGNLVANEEVFIKSELPGKLIRLYFKEGNWVKAGQLLAKTDGTQLYVNREKMKVALELAESELDRGKSLLDVKGITQEEVDRLENQVKSIQADLKINQVQRNKTKIYAPFSGMLGLKQVSIGAYITPSDPIVQLQQIHPIKLEFEVPEKYLNRIGRNQELSFTVQGQDEVYQAKVYTKGTEISPTTRTFKVRGITANRKRELLPGQFANIRLITSTNNQAILIPTDAVIPVLGGKIVYLTKNGKATSTHVVTGDRQSDLIEIQEGVSAGDTVLVSGLLALSDGVPVNVNNLVNSTENTGE
jgi:membrane fusion protein (multidrug efflux system)